ncbi:unnamed protein product [Orchesella dallaii]|uniref:Gustatory receptor n=1 Tax=Orchesella dallaii TaxID=48710 RepID=A0ABP1QHY8_9HEXA
MLFDFGYYIGIVPFKFVFNEEGSVILKCRSWQKHLNKILFLLWTSGYLLRGIAKVSLQPSDVIAYFNVGHVIFHTTMLYLFYTKLYSNQDNCFQLLTEIDKCPLADCPPLFLKKQWMWFPFHFMAIVMIAFMTMLTNFALPKSKWILPEHFHKMADPIKSLFQNVDEQEDSNILIENVSTFDLGFGLLFGFMEFLSCLEVTIRVLCCLHPMSLLLSTANSFLRNTYSQDGAQWLKLTKDYEHLKKLSSIISDTWGPLILCFVLDYTVWLATDLDAALKVKQWATGVTTIYFMMSLSTSTILCAEVKRRMASFKVWIIRNGDSIFGNRQEEFTRFLHSLDNDQVGVGIFGVYQIDYPFLGQEMCNNDKSKCEATNKYSGCRPPLTSKEICERYSQLKDLSDALNESWGGLVIIGLFNYISWLSTDLEQLLQAVDFMSRFTLFWYSVGTFLPAVVCAEVQRKRKRKCHLIKFCYSLFFIGSTCISYVKVLDGCNWNFKNFIFHSSLKTLYWNSTIAETLPTSNGTNLGELFYNIVLVLSLITYQLSTSFRILAFFHPATTLLNAVETFTKKVYQLEDEWNSPEETKALIWSSYNELKRLADALNEFWGALILVSILDYVAWLTTDLDMGLTSSGWLGRITVVWYFATIFFPMITSGECCRRVRT